METMFFKVISVLICLNISSISGFQLKKYSTASSSSSSSRRQKVHKFGCTFEDDNYRLNCVEPDRHVYGVELNEGYPVTKTSLAELLGTISQIRKIYKDDFNFNELEAFVKFYKDYKKSGSKTFSNFYDSYNFPYASSKHLSFNMNIKLFDSLIKKYPGIAPYVFLSECFHQTQDELVLDNQDLSTTMGTIKIKLTEGSTVKEGYIFINELLNWEEPAVKYTNDRLHWTLISSRNRGSYWLEFISNNQFLRINPVPNNDEIITNHVCNIRQPYCSFLNSYAKRSMLQGKLTMSPRPLRSSSYFILSVNLVKESPEITISDSENTKPITIPFQAYSYEQISGFLHAIDHQMNRFSGYSWKLLNQIHGIITDESFFTQFQNKAKDI